MTLLDHRGNPVNGASFKRATSPRTGPSAVLWGQDGQNIRRLPQGGIVQFNLDNLGIPDFRAMRDHYQVNASLAVLSFMQHQSDWHIECEDKKIADECELQLREVWTPLNRALSTANWAGYSPNILEWENDAQRGKVVLDKIKDMIPESSEVHWKEVDAWVPAGYADKAGIRKPKVKIYDGIKQLGTPWPIPPENTIWYPLLMENGDYNGRKLLKAAFQSWYFSILIHLFANRYYERFGEPIVVGRAPFEDYVTIPGSDTKVSGIEYMLQVIKDLRSRSVVALPDEKTEMGNSRFEYDYSLEYLESQMRGADWERYLTRLDEEISIGLFTPILLLRTADVGSYNLGVGHMQMYLWMLNAMNDDRKLYIDKYILSKIVDYNYSPNAPRAKIKFRKLGNQNMDMVKSIVDELLKAGKVGFDVTELGEISGMSMREIQATVVDTGSGADANNNDPTTDNTGDPQKQNPSTDPGSSTKPRATTKDITARVLSQVKNHIKAGTWGPGCTLDLGFQRKMEEALLGARIPQPQAATARMYDRVSEWMDEALLSKPDAQVFMDRFTKVLEYEITEVEHGQ